MVNLLIDVGQQIVKSHSHSHSPTHINIAGTVGKAIFSVFISCLFLIFSNWIELSRMDKFYSKCFVSLPPPSEHTCVPNKWNWPIRFFLNAFTALENVRRKLTALIFNGSSSPNFHWTNAILDIYVLLFQMNHYNSSISFAIVSLISQH